MREFEDHDGERWKAGIGSRDGLDYKGRFFFVVTPVKGGPSVELQDVRWNSEHTARRTLATMSDVELRRRLRSARGRARSSGKTPRADAS
jgi:hypothetical protein